MDPEDELCVLVNLALDLSKFTDSTLSAAPDAWRTRLEVSQKLETSEVDFCGRCMIRLTDEGSVPPGHLQAALTTASHGLQPIPTPTVLWGLRGQNAAGAVDRPERPL